MEKEDLKTGMVVRKGNGYFMIFRDTYAKDFYISGEGIWDYLTYLNWESIESVYSLDFQSQTWNFFNKDISDISLNILWRRTTKREIYHPLTGNKIEISEESYQNIKKDF